MNPPVVRDGNWLNKVNSYITHKPDHVRIVQAQYDFGNDDFVGAIDRPVEAGYDPNLHFQSFNTLTVSYPGSDGSLDANPFRRASRGLEQHLWTNLQPPWINIDEKIHGRLAGMMYPAASYGNQFNP